MCLVDCIEYVLVAQETRMTAWLLRNSALQEADKVDPELTQ